MTLLRVYEPGELARDGYPAAWRRCGSCGGSGLAVEADELGNAYDVECPTCAGAGSIKGLIRELAGHRCVRCGHPYRTGAHGSGEWTPCDEGCTHLGPIRVLDYATRAVRDQKQIIPAGELVQALTDAHLAGGMAEMLVQAQWRILTVHHLTGEKADCRWWNLAALCQRCHLTIQGRVVMERAFILEHSDWFKPYAAGWYAWKYLGVELSREETLGRLDELLDLERVA